MSLRIRIRICIVLDSDILLTTEACSIGDHMTSLLTKDNHSVAYLHLTSFKIYLPKDDLESQGYKK